MPKATPFRIQGVDAAITEAVADLIVEDNELVNALIGDLERHDARATYVEDTFAVTEVEIASNGELRVHYSFQWEAHYGCQDMCASEVETDYAVGRIEGGDLVFQLTRYDKRTTVDEF